MGIFGKIGGESKLFKTSRASDEGINTKKEKKGSWSCNGINFKQVTAGNAVTYGTSTGIVTSNADGTGLCCPVNLPDGAEITDMHLWGTSEDNYYLTRTRHTTGAGQDLIEGTPNLEYHEFVKSTIDNLKYGYFIYIGNVNNGQKVYGVKIEYIY